MNSSSDGDMDTFDKEEAGPTQRKKAPRMKRAGSSSDDGEACEPTMMTLSSDDTFDKEEARAGPTAAAHLDEKFPFLTIHIGKYWIAAVTCQFVLYAVVWYVATMKLDVAAAGGSWAGEEADEAQLAGAKPSSFENFIFFTSADPQPRAVSAPSHATPSRRQLPRRANATDVQRAKC